MRRCHTASGKASTEQHYRHTQQMWAISSSCWCTVLTTLQHLHGKEPNSASQTEERRNNTLYQSLGLCSKLSLCVAGWNPGISLDQCTMHTVVIYFKKYGVLHHISLCIISDDLEQDTCFVHELQRIVTLYIRENLPQIKFVDNFSDSCAMHSKKYKAFLNLCHHK